MQQAQISKSGAGANSLIFVTSLILRTKDMRRGVALVTKPAPRWGWSDWPPRISHVKTVLSHTGQKASGERRHRALQSAHAREAAMDHESEAMKGFLILAKSAKGAACESLIRSVLDHPSIYVFGELLEMPNVQEVLSTHCAPQPRADTRLRP